MTVIEALASWAALNNILRICTEKDCEELLRAERKGKKRVNYLLRIYGRFNTLRCTRERKELIAA